MMRTLAGLILLIGTFLLSACSTWQGPRFYAASESVDPLPAGVYRVVQNEKQADYRWDGTQFTRVGTHKGQRDKLGGMVAVPLGLPGHAFYLVQFADNSTHDTQNPDDAFYLLFGGTGEHFVLTMPDCAATAAIVREAGGVVETLTDGHMFAGENELRCRFTSRANLETAARRYVTERSLTGIHFTRIGD